MCLCPRADSSWKRRCYHASPCCLDNEILILSLFRTFCYPGLPLPSHCSLFMAKQSTTIPDGDPRKFYVALTFPGALFPSFSSSSLLLNLTASLAPLFLSPRVLQCTARSPAPRPSILPDLLLLINPSECDPMASTLSPTNPWPIDTTGGRPVSLPCLETKDNVGRLTSKVLTEPLPSGAAGVAVL